MKRKKWSILSALLALLSFSAACSQFGGANNPVEQIVTLCKTGKYKEAAKHFLNKSKCKDPNNIADCVLNYESGDEKDKQGVQSLCEEVKGYVGASYTVGSEQAKEQKGASFYQYNVEVKRGDKTEKQVWFFRKNGGDYVFAEIEK